MIRRKTLLIVSVSLAIGLMIGFQVSLLPTLLTNIPETNTSTNIAGAQVNVTTTTSPSITSTSVTTKIGEEDYSWLKNPIRLPPVILNTVDYASRVVNETIVVPDVSRLGPTYKLLGVEITRKPIYYEYNHTTHKIWGVTLFISDKPFINGTTRPPEPRINSIRVYEYPLSGFSSNHYNFNDSAIHLVQQTYERCLPDSPPPCYKYNITLRVLNIRNVSIVDYLSGSTIVDIDKIGRGFLIAGNSTFQQRLELADSLIP